MGLAVAASVVVEVASLMPTVVESTLMVGLALRLLSVDSLACASFCSRSWIFCASRLSLGAAVEVALESSDASDAVGTVVVRCFRNRCARSVGEEEEDVAAVSVVVVEPPTASVVAAVVVLGARKGWALGAAKGLFLVAAGSSVTTALLSSSVEGSTVVAAESERPTENVSETVLLTETLRISSPSSVATSFSLVLAEAVVVVSAAGTVEVCGLVCLLSRLTASLCGNT
jgi:hypothetical protein